MAKKPKEAPEAPAKIEEQAAAPQLDPQLAADYIAKRQEHEQLLAKVREIEDEREKLKAEIKAKIEEFEQVRGLAAMTGSNGSLTHSDAIVAGQTAAEAARAILRAGFDPEEVWEEYLTRPAPESETPPDAETETETTEEAAP